MLHGTLSRNIKETIERFAVKLKTTHPLRSTVESGQFTQRALGLYLESLRHLFECSEANISKAAASAKNLKTRPLLEAYLDKKRKEERDHDRWAINDLALLPLAAIEGVKPTPTIIKLVEFQDELIDLDPVFFVAYAQWAEYFSVHIGDEWLDALTKNGFDRSRVTAVSNHLGPDRDHADAGFREIDDLCSESAPYRDELLTKMLGVVVIASDLFYEFCTELNNECMVQEL